MDPARDLWQYNYRTWSRQNGLPVNGINAIAQTKDGYIWLGTLGGLLRFDGIDFSLINLAQASGLRNRTVKGLTDRREGGLWVGLENSSFGFYDDQGFTFKGKSAWGGLNLNVKALITARDGTIWFAADKEICRLTPTGEFETVLKLPGDIIINGASIFQDAQGRVWIGTIDHGLYYWENGKINKFSDPTLDVVSCITQDHEGQFWFGTDKGVRRYDANFQRQSAMNIEAECSALYVDREGVLWIGTKTLGLIRYWAGRYSAMRKNDGLPGEYVNAVMEDREGSLWVGTGSGLCQLTDVKFPSEPPTQNEIGEYAGAVAASTNGGIWIASKLGVSHFDGKYKTYTGADGLPPGPVKRVFEKSNGDIYFVSGYTTLSILSKEKVVKSFNAPTLVVGMAEDKQGVIVSVGGELFRADENSLTPYVYVGAKPDFRWILNICLGKDGTLWVACENGIFSVKNGVARKRAGADALPDPRVQWIFEDDEGIIWASLFTGIARLKGDKLCCIGRKDGLFDNDIYGVMADNFGELWVDSSRGMFRVSRKSMNDFADGKSDHVECHPYDGAESSNIADKTAKQERVVCKSLDGRIWFPSPNGVVVIDPSHIPTNRVPPPVHIDRVKANQKEFIRGQGAVQPGDGELEFHFTALTFIAPQKTHFRYQLKGYDHGWVEAQDRRIAFYTNLKPGDYTFQVIAANSDGVWNETGDSIDIHLLPHFHQTIWFYIICVSVVLAGLGGVYVARMQVVERKQKTLQQARDLLEAEVQKRTAELASVNGSLKQEVDDHKVTELQLKERTKALEKEIEDRKQMEMEVERVHRQLVDTSRQAGMAEIATNVLHNVGNVLNSVNVSSSVVLDCVKKSSIAGVAKVVALLREHANHLGEFFNENPRGKQLPAYLEQLSGRLTAEQQMTMQELESLRGNIEHIKEIVAMQQSYATVSGIKEIVDLRELVEDSLRMNMASLRRHGIELIREFAEIAPMTVDKHKILQILVNLVRNAKYACDDSGRTDKRITVRVIEDEADVKITVTDNGIGIPQENLTRIFGHGFTTRKDGHGFGLHSGALAAKEMGGSLNVESAGLGHGATFILSLPSVDKKQKRADLAATVS